MYETMFFVKYYIRLINLQYLRKACEADMRTTHAPNRLINEKSPYLLQHAYNPVDWYPWGQEAFDKALSEDKPVFLSIGYSTCHWWQSSYYNH